MFRRNNNEEKNEGYAKLQIFEVDDDEYKGVSTSIILGSRNVQDQNHVFDSL